MLGTRVKEVIMAEPFVGTETDRTKSKWVAKAYQDFVEEFGRSRTTLRTLFYYALQRKASDYPICGGFVGEIRITRPYHESDGERLPKWVNKARRLGFIPEDAILEEIPEECIFIPKIQKDRPYSIEVWLNKSALNPLLYPICEKYSVNLVSVNSRPSNQVIEDLFKRCKYSTIILCLSDLSSSGFSFCRDLAQKIVDSEPSRGDLDIRLKRISLLPEQILELKIPMVHGIMGSNEDKDSFKKYLKSYALDPKRMAELDALEVYYPGGVGRFLDETLSKYSNKFDSDFESWLLDLKKGVFPNAMDFDIIK
ncbi:MAG: hypothetical protein LUQ38_00360 [Methanotrichaceae archaeon]|nr:hypothetical protein [Methanotrichaceae archaeon]